MDTCAQACAYMYASHNHFHLFLSFNKYLWSTSCEPDPCLVAGDRTIDSDICDSITTDSDNTIERIKLNKEKESLGGGL